jgi:hypothetical protein
VGRLTAECTYTAAGRLATANIDLAGNDEPDGFVETYTFDAAGNLTSVGEGTSLTYDSNRLATMTADGSTTYFFFDSGQGWRTAQAPSNDPSDPDRTTFAYTGTGRLQEYAGYQDGTEIVSATYTYDAQGQRTRSVVEIGTETTITDFTYTGLTLHKLSATRTGGADPGSWTITYLYDEYGRPYAGVYRDTSTTENPPCSPPTGGMWSLCWTPPGVCCLFCRHRGRTGSGSRAAVTFPSRLRLACPGGVRPSAGRAFWLLPAPVSCLWQGGRICVQNG